MDEKSLNELIQKGDTKAIEKELNNGLNVDFTFKDNSINNEIGGYTLLDVAVSARRKEVRRAISCRPWRRC